MEYHVYTKHSKTRKKLKKYRSLFKEIHPSAVKSLVAAGYSGFIAIENRP